MKNYNNNPNNQFMPCDSEEDPNIPMDTPEDTIEIPIQNPSQNQLNSNNRYQANTISTNINFPYSNNNNINNDNYKKEIPSASFDSNNNKSKIIPKQPIKKNLYDDDDEDLTDILNDKSNKTENKLNEKSVVINPNQYSKKAENDNQKNNKNFIRPLTEIEKRENDKINFNNYTDDLIESFFEKNNSDNPNFYFDLAKTMETGQRQINYKLDKMLRDDEINNSKLNQKKQEYIDKLENMKKKHSIFETNVNNLNELYCDKLSYISLISKNLYDYEKFHKNIDFATKLFKYINELNKTDDFSQLVIPKDLSDSELIIKEGLEIYLAFKEILETCKSIPGYTNFVLNFNTLETKLKNTIKFSIAQNYTENNLEKLQHIFSVTELMNNDLIINLYISFITEDIMKLNENIASMRQVQFKVDGISEDLFTLIFKQADDFHEILYKNASEQFGSEYSKIYILFPESKQKLVLATMINEFLKYLTEFRNILISEKDKNEETYVRIVQYIYPKTMDFNSKYKKLVEFTKTDLEGALEQETNIFLRTVEGIYMSKEKILLDSFITSSYNSRILKIRKMKEEYNQSLKKKKPKGNDLTIFINDYITNLLDQVQSTNFSMLVQKTNITISRYNMLIKNKAEKQDLAETFCKEVFDSIQNLLCEYCLFYKFLLEECTKKNQSLIEKHFYLLSKIDYCKSQFKQIFLNDLKDFFTNMHFYDMIEDYIIKCVYQIELEIDSAFSILSSYTSSEYKKILNCIRNKDTYKKSKLQTERINSEEFQKIIDFLRPIFNAIKENWGNLDKYQNMLSILITNMTSGKMKDILRDAKVNIEGAKVMKNDFQKMAKTFEEYTDDFYYNEIYDVAALTDIYNVNDNELDGLVQRLEKEGKYEIDLIKILLKKRNNLK